MAQRSKNIEVTKFSQLIEYNMRKIFLEKYIQNLVVQRVVLGHFLKNQNWTYLCINSP